LPTISYVETRLVPSVKTDTPRLCRALIPF